VVAAVESSARAFVDPGLGDATRAEAPAPTVRRCARCLCDDEIPAILFDDAGVCNYCAVHDRMDADNPNGAVGKRRFEEMVKEIREAGRGRAFDLIIGVSGGCDSTYMLYKAREYGLRPLAVHFDNTWNSATATENIHRVLKKLDIELYTHVVDNGEYDEMLRAFLLSGTPDIDCPTDIGLAATLFRAAESHGIRYQWEGHSFRTEGIHPLGYVYMDQKYIASVVAAHGRRPVHFTSYPTLWLREQLKWMLIGRIKKIRPLYHLDYHKEEAKQFLTKELSWKWYGGHHLENRYTAFLHSWYFPKRYGRDIRVIADSARVRSGQLTRDEGLAVIAEPIKTDPQTIELVKRRLAVTDADLERILHAPKKTFRDYDTYKPTFERMRPFFWAMAKLQLVPESFYIKYTSKSSI
jgi:hypothetical protein